MSFKKDASHEHAEVFKFSDDNDVLILLLPRTAGEVFLTPDEFAQMVRDVHNGMDEMRKTS